MQGPSYFFLDSSPTLGRFGERLSPLPPQPHRTAATAVITGVLAASARISLVNKLVRIASSYNVLERETRVCKVSSILEHLDIAGMRKKGNRLILLCCRDCHDCVTAIPKQEQVAHDLAGSDDFLRILLIQPSPHAQCLVRRALRRVLGLLADVEERFVMIAAVALLTDGSVESQRQEDTFQNARENEELFTNVSSSSDSQSYSPRREGRLHLRSN